MAQFIYQQTGKMRHAAVLSDTVSFKLSGCTGLVYWTNRPRPTAYTGMADASPFYDSFMPLVGQEGIIQGATALMVVIEELHGLFAMLETLAIEDPEQRVWGQLAAMNGLMNNTAQNMRVIAQLI